MTMRTREKERKFGHKERKRSAKPVDSGHLCWHTKTYSPIQTLIWGDITVENGAPVAVSREAEVLQY